MTIQSFAFAGTNLSNVDLSDANVNFALGTGFGSGGFFEGTQMTTIKLPSNMTTLPNSFLRYNTAIETLDLSNTKITSINGWALDGCSNLKTVYLPNGTKFDSSGVATKGTLTTIGESAFSNTPALSYVGEKPANGSTQSANTLNLTTLALPYKAFYVFIVFCTSFLSFIND